MIKVSRRLLAEHAASQLVKGRPATTLAKEVVAVMAQDNRLGEVELLFKDIEYYLESRGQVASATMVSAHELSEDLILEIKRLIKDATDTDHVRLSSSIDESVIGGARIETATRIWDNTVAGQLQELRESFYGSN